MPSPVRFAVVRKMLEAAGWQLTHIRGSHHHFKKSGHRTFPFPVHHGKVAPEYVREVEKLIRQDNPPARG